MNATVIVRYPDTYDDFYIDVTFVDYSANGAIATLSMIQDLQPVNIS